MHIFPTQLVLTSHSLRGRSRYNACKARHSSNGWAAACKINAPQISQWNSRWKNNIFMCAELCGLDRCGVVCVMWVDCGSGVAKWIYHLLQTTFSPMKWRQRTRFVCETPNDTSAALSCCCSRQGTMWTRTQCTHRIAEYTQILVDTSVSHRQQYPNKFERRQRVTRRHTHSHTQPSGSLRKIITRILHAKKNRWNNSMSERNEMEKDFFFRGAKRAQKRLRRRTKMRAVEDASK